MPMVRAMRLMNSIEAGSTNSTTLQQSLTNGGVSSDFNSVLQLPGQCNVLAASNTALGAISGSALATTAAVNSPYLNTAIVNNSTSRAYLQSSGRPLLQSLATANQPAWIANATYPTQGASLNGIALTTGNLSTCYEVAYGNSVYVAIANSGTTTYTSTDGINWTTNTSVLPTPTAGAWASITFGNGYFVAVSGYSGASSVAAYSTNGVSWTTAALPSASNWSSVAYGNISGTNYFVAVAGGNGAATTVNAYSTNNGATWTAGSALPSSAIWQHIAFGNGAFVVLPGANKTGSGTASTVSATTTNPTSTWTAGGALSASLVWGQLAVGTISATTYFVTVSSTGVINYSTNNGATWTIGTTSLGTCYGVAFGNGYFVVQNTAGLIAFSNNGTSFTTGVVNSQNVGSGAPSYITYGTNFVSVPTSGSSSGILTGTPNVNSVFATYARSNFYGTCSTYLNGTYYILGFGAVYTSTDAATWTKTLVPAFTVLGGIPAAVAVGSISGTNYFMCVQNLGVSGQVASYSTDGLNWTCNSTALGTNALWSAVAYGIVGTTPCFVAVAGGQTQYGGAFSTSSAYSYSTNGSSWTTSVTMSSAHQYSDVVIGGGYAVAIPYEVSGLYSYTNTLSGGWTDVAVTTPSGGINIVYANGYFVMSGSGFVYSLLLASLGGVWTSVSMPSGFTPFAIGTNGSVIVAFSAGANAVGTQVVATYSTSSTTWTSSTLTNVGTTATVGRPAKINYGNGIFFSANPTSSSSTPVAITSY